MASEIRRQHRQRLENQEEAGRKADRRGNIQEGSLLEERGREAEETIEDLEVARLS